MFEQDLAGREEITLSRTIAEAAQQTTTVDDPEHSVEIVKDPLSRLNSGNALFFTNSLTSETWFEECILNPAF